MLEDVHMNVESRLTDIIVVQWVKSCIRGVAVTIVATDIRLWLREETDNIIELGLVRLQRPT